jgi:hypothetical protein
VRIRPCWYHVSRNRQRQAFHPSDSGSIPQNHRAYIGFDASSATYDVSFLLPDQSTSNPHQALQSILVDRFNAAMSEKTVEEACLDFLSVRALHILSTCCRLAHYPSAVPCIKPTVPQIAARPARSGVAEACHPRSDFVAAALGADRE